MFCRSGFREFIFTIIIIIIVVIVVVIVVVVVVVVIDSVIMILILDGEEVNIVEVSSGGQDKSQCWNPRLPNGSAPSSIHNDSSSNSTAHNDSSSNSTAAASDESSVLESISGRTRDRILASDNGTRKADSKIQSAELWKLPDDRFDSADPVCSYADFEDVQLNETLRSLMETKTPMLPSRLGTALKRQLNSRPSAAFVESRNVPTCHVTQTSARNAVLFPLSKRSNNTTEHDPGRVRESIDTDSQSAVYPAVVESLISEVDQKDRNISGKGSSRVDARSLLSELSSDVQSSTLKSSVPAAATDERDLLGYSVPVVTSSLLTVPDTDSLDSLVARYRSVRDCSAVDHTLAKVSGSKTDSKPVSHVEHLPSTSTALSNLTTASIRGTSKTVNEHGPCIASHCVLQPTLVAQRVLQQSTDSVDRVAEDDIEHDLCSDNFDDIRLNLQNISMDSAYSPAHASLQQKGQWCDLKLRGAFKKFCNSI